MEVKIDFDITETAVSNLKDLLTESDGKILRISVSSGGCSASYGLGFIEESEIMGSDVSGEYGGLKVVVDRKSLLQLDGVVVDWVEEGDRKGFKFINKSPKSCCRKGSC
jgi:iron-sulfur cluster assembly protein